MNVVEVPIIYKLLSSDLTTSEHGSIYVLEVTEANGKPRGSLTPTDFDLPPTERVDSSKTTRPIDNRLVDTERWN